MTTRICAALISLLVLGFLLGCPAQETSLRNQTATNLITNADAEDAVGSSDGYPVPTPGWTSSGQATALKYDVAGGYPLRTDPGPAERGLNLFCGGISNEAPALTQSIDVSRFAGSIDGGGATYELSGWLGGYSTQGDEATVTVTFQGTSFETLGTSAIGPVTPADRGNNTGLAQRSTTGAVPVGTRSILVVISMARKNGSANDGYADNLSLTLAGL